MIKRLYIYIPLIFIFLCCGNYGSNSSKNNKTPTKESDHNDNNKSIKSKNNNLNKNINNKNLIPKSNNQKIDSKRIYKKNNKSKNNQITFNNKINKSNKLSSKTIGNILYVAYFQNLNDKIFRYVIKKSINGSEKQITWGDIFSLWENPKFVDFYIDILNSCPFKQYFFNCKPASKINDTFEFVLIETSNLYKNSDGKNFKSHINSSKNPAYIGLEKKVLNKLEKVFLLNHSVKTYL